MTEYLHPAERALRRALPELLELLGPTGRSGQIRLAPDDKAAAADSLRMCLDKWALAELDRLIKLAVAPALRAAGAEIRLQEPERVPCVVGGITFDDKHVAVWAGRRLVGAYATDRSTRPGTEAVLRVLRHAMSLADAMPLVLLSQPTDDASAHARLGDRDARLKLAATGASNEDISEITAIDTIEIIAAGPVVAIMSAECDLPYASRALVPALHMSQLPKPTLTRVQKDLLQRAQRGTTFYPGRQLLGWESGRRDLKAAKARPLQALFDKGLLALRPLPLGERRTEYWAVEASLCRTGPRAPRISESERFDLRTLRAFESEGLNVYFLLRQNRLQRLGLIEFSATDTFYRLTPAGHDEAERKVPRRILLSQAQARALRSGRKTVHVIPDQLHPVLDRPREDAAERDPARPQKGTLLVFETRVGRRRVPVATARVTSGERIWARGTSGENWIIDVNFEDRDFDDPMYRLFCPFSPRDSFWKREARRAARAGRRANRPDPRLTSLARAFGLRSMDALASLLGTELELRNGVLVRFNRVTPLPAKV